MTSQPGANRSNKSNTRGRIDTMIIGVKTTLISIDQPEPNKRARERMWATQLQICIQETIFSGLFFGTFSKLKTLISEWYIHPIKLAGRNRIGGERSWFQPFRFG